MLNNKNSSVYNNPNLTINIKMPQLIFRKLKSDCKDFEILNHIGRGKYSEVYLGM